MPYEENSSLTTPHDETVLWRYLDLAKFLKLLECSALYFSAPWQFEDGWEGIISPAHQADLEGVMTGSVGRVGQVLAQVFPRAHGVNAWHMNSSESIAMWSLYTPGGDGVCIKSSIGRLKSSLADVSQHVYIGRVDYEMFDRPLPRVVVAGESNILYSGFDPLFVKRACFRHEDEVRAVTSLIAPSRIPFDQPYSEINAVLRTLPGVELKTQLAALIDEIVFGPTFPHWGESIIRNACERAGLGELVFRRSDVLSRPLSSM